MPKTRLQLRHDYETGRLYCIDSESNLITDELVIPSTQSGCDIEEFLVSPSGDWIVTARSSGQGEWGFDVISNNPLRHCGGIPEQLGYMLELPRFSADESYLLGGYGENWLGGWWSHPECLETPSPGGAITFGWLFVHKLETQKTAFHELKMNLPTDWLPSDPEDEIWFGATQITPLSTGGVAMQLPGKISFEIDAPLSGIVQIPTPHPKGGRFI